MSVRFLSGISGFQRAFCPFPRLGRLPSISTELPPLSWQTCHLVPNASSLSGQQLDVKIAQPTNWRSRVVPRSSAFQARLLPQVAESPAQGIGQSHQGKRHHWQTVEAERKTASAGRRSRHVHKVRSVDIVHGLIGAINYGYLASYYLQKSRGLILSYGRLAW